MKKSKMAKFIPIAVFALVFFLNTPGARAQGEEYDYYDYGESYDDGGYYDDWGAYDYGDSTSEYDDYYNYGEDPLAGMNDSEINALVNGEGDNRGQYSGGYLEFAGNESLKTPEGGYAFLMQDEGGNKAYYTFNQNGDPEFYSEWNGGAGAEQSGYFGVVDGSGNKVEVDEKGALYYKDQNGDRLYYSDLQKEIFKDAETGEKYDLSTGDIAPYSDENGQFGIAKIDSSTGKVSSFTSGGQTYAVGYNQVGQPFYTNGAGQQVLLGQGVSGSTIGGATGATSGVGSWMSGLLGLSGGIGYNSITGFSGGIGFGSTTGYGTPAGSVVGYGAGTGGYGTGAYYGGTAAAGGWNPANYISTGLPVGSVYAIIMNIAMWALGVFGFIAIIGFIISGIMYLTAAGDEKSQEKAKKAMYYSITGVIVGLVGLVVIFAVHSLLQGASYF